MALRLSELQRRVKQQSRHKKTYHKRPLRTQGMSARPSPRIFSAMSENADGLAAKLVANGASQAEAERLAVAIASIEKSHAASLPSAMEQRTVPMPQVKEAKGLAIRTILTILDNTPIDYIVEGLFLLCDKYNIAVSLGLGFLAAVGFGKGAHGGIVFGPNRQVGWYGSLGSVMGWVASVSGSLILTGVKGGLPAFNGQSVTVGGTVGVENPLEPFSPGVGAHLIFNAQGWVGLSVEVSISAGLSPIEVFEGEWETVSHTVQARSLSAPYVVSSLSDSPSFAMSVPVVVNARLRAFIPAPAIAVELPVVGTDLAVFSGDGRSFSYDQGTHRCQIDASLQMRDFSNPSVILSNNPVWGTTHQYNLADTQEVSDKPSWWRSINAGASPIESKALDRTESNLNIEIGGFGTRDAVYGAISDDSMFTFMIDGGIPLLPSVAPNINARLRLVLRNNNGSVQAKVHGTHDGFPAYEMYVEGRRIHHYDPLAAGETPMALNGLADGEINVDTEWFTIGSANDLMAHGN